MFIRHLVSNAIQINNEVYNYYKTMTSNNNTKLTVKGNYDSENVKTLS